jgi:hypothetical protein
MLTKGGAVVKNTYSVSKVVGGTPPARIDVGEPEYVVVNANDLTLYAANMVAKTSTEACLMHDQLVAADPSLKGQVLVVSSHELN